MKRIFAILLAAMVLPAMLLTGCSEKNEEIDVQNNNAFVGTWYAIESKRWENTLCTFNSDGSYIGYDWYSEKQTGTYTVKNEFAEVLVIDNEIYSYTGIIYEDVLFWEYVGVKSELTENCLLYDEGKSVYEYFDNLNQPISPLLLSKEKAVFPDQKDILGEWLIKKDGETVGKCVVEEKNIILVENDTETTLPIILKGGKVTAVGDIPENMLWRDRYSLLHNGYIYLCGGKMYVFNDTFPTILEKE